MNILQKQLQHVCSFSSSFLCDPTRRTEEEGLRFSQVLVHCICDGHLSVGEGAEGLFISWTHLSLDVIKQ